jgi:hypothetical protein
MYPINIKTKNNASAPNVSDAWVKMIHDDMNLCIENFRKNHIRAELKTEKMTNKRKSILNFCAAQMIGNAAT